MVRLVGKDVTGAFKAKAQSGILFRRGNAVVPFCLEVKVNKKKDETELVERRWWRYK